MSSFYTELIDWSEAWALLIPLFFMIRNKSNAVYLRPVRWYIILALVINIAATLIQKYKIKWGFHDGDFLWSNNFLYNIHSVVRLILFSLFFNLLGQRFMHRLKALLPFLFLAAVLINFIFFEDFFDRRILSSRLLATEAAILLFYCLQYFIYLMLEERGTPLRKQPGFYIVIGLTFYVAASFFIFLFYQYLVEQNIQFAIDIWDVHNFAYIFFCVCMAIAFKKNND